MADTAKQIWFNLTDILRKTSKEYVGKYVWDFSEVYVATIYDSDKKQYDLYTIVDLDTEYKNLVIVDNKTMRIVDKVKGV